MKRKLDDGSEVLVADLEHPVSSHLKADGGLSQQGISCDGFQREVGVNRHTELVPGGKKQRYKFCWDLHLYQHPGCRKIVPLGCTRSDGTGHTPAPKLAREFSRAFHRLAQMGGSGANRARYWHQFVAPMLCGSGDIDVKRLRRELKLNGLLGETSSLDGLRRRNRKGRR